MRADKQGLTFVFEVRVVRVTYCRRKARSTRWRSSVLSNHLKSGEKKRESRIDYKTLISTLKRNAIAKQIRKCEPKKKRGKRTTKYDCTSRFSKSGTGNVLPQCFAVHSLAQFGPEQYTEEWINEKGVENRL